MFKNYLRVALRNLTKHKLYAFINIVGLAIGLACCILIYLFVNHEFSYDNFHKNGDRIYRIHVTEKIPGRDLLRYSATPPPLAPAMEESFPEVEAAVRLATRRDIVRQNNENFNETHFLVDNDFFEIFDYKLKQGDPAQVLQDPGSVVLTESQAQKLFGTPNVVGKQLSIKLGEEFYEFTVSGIAEDVPVNSSIQFNMAISFDNALKYQSQRAMEAWFNVWLETYVLLPENFDPAQSEEKLTAVVKKHYPEDSPEVNLFLQPLHDIYLNPDIPSAVAAVSDPQYSYILMGIGLLILGIACINFTTLAMGRSTTRNKEVGVRKVLGAVKGQLIKQFWGEAMLMSFIALILGLGLAVWALPHFNDISQKQLTFSLDFLTIGAILVLVLLVGVLAGSYPALVLSRFQPAIVMRGDSQMGGAKFFGRSLVVLQFALSIFLLISTFVMGDQISYMQTKDLGFNDEQVVVVRNNSPMQETGAVVERLRTALSSRSDVLGVSGASNQFGGGWTLMGFRDAQDNFRQFYQQTVDYDYLETMQMDLLAGRNFSRQFGTDSMQALIVNEATVEFFGWENGLGQKLPGNNFPPHQVVGVVKDFNFQSLESPVGPVVLSLTPQPLFRGINDINTSTSPRLMNFVHVRISPNDIPETMAALEKEWKTASSGQAFVYTFLDEDVEAQYRDFQRWESVVQYAAAFAILIACLGLFGLAALTVARRTKEIGIRKVLGAGSPSIVGLLAGDFGKLVIIANIVAIPFAVFFMNEWLQDFAYRVGMGVDNFVLSTVLALFIAFFAVSYQSVRAALSNPVKSIRIE